MASSSSSPSPVQKERIAWLNKQDLNTNGKYVLYWMQSSVRCQSNHALEFAAERANLADKPLLVVFGLVEREYHPQANLRHYAFMLEGLADAQQRLATERKCRLVVAKCKSPVDLIANQLAQDAVEVIVDRSYTRVPRMWYRQLADRLVDLGRRLTQVESNVVVPVELVSSCSEFGARTIRPKIWRFADSFLVELPTVPLLRDGLKEKLINDAEFDLMDLSNDKCLEKAIAGLNVDRSVSRITTMKGGQTEAQKTLDKFISERLAHYDERRNKPGEQFQSYLSPYLHFGHISPIDAIRAVRAAKTSKANKDSFIEELLVRRELAINFVWYEPDAYDSLRCLPDWARKTINEHRNDPRVHLYTYEQLENGDTHDQYWNAAQLEMVHQGKMHGYMRMYWGKKVIQWTSNMEEAYKFLIEQNDKYELDGREPNGYEGVVWCFGKHDRAHAERAVFGKLRFMNDEGLKRKFKSINDYVRSCYRVAGKKQAGVPDDFFIPPAAKRAKKTK
uniref:Deoxyribodipyrimidine photo-lyase n=1 Tax=Plectus sambesii TaxID=2011161 RepID=A0A914XQ95_9BILA